MSSSATDELLRILRQRETQGQRTVDLSPEEWRQFRMAAIKPGAARAGSQSSVRDASRPPQERRPARDRPAPRPDRPRSEAAPLTPVRDVSQLDLGELKTCVASCRACPLHAGRKQTVFSDGDGSSGLMFIGEGPGAEEDRQGFPFVGPAGQLLTRMIEAMQFRRDEVYIANIVKCRPPGNRNPNEEEAATCLGYLRRQIELVKPKVIVVLGAVPLRYLLHENGINACHGKWFDYEAIPVLPTFHPAYLLRIEGKKREAWEDLKKVMRKLGRDPDVTRKQRGSDGSSSRSTRG